MDFGETYYRGFPIRGFAGWLYDEGWALIRQDKATKLLKRLGSVPKPDERIPSGIQRLTYLLLSIKDWRKQDFGQGGVNHGATESCGWRE
jgi:hypothetical protein